MRPERRAAERVEMPHPIPIPSLSVRLGVSTVLVSTKMAIDEVTTVVLMHDCDGSMHEISADITRHADLQNGAFFSHLFH